MRILVLDDEKQFAALVADCVHDDLQARNIPHTIDVFADSAAFQDAAGAYDMAFLDIRMQGPDGIEVARRLQKRNAHVVLFMVTAYDQYLDDAMDLHVFRYIQKPLDEQRLRAGLEKALEQIRGSTVDVYLSERKETLRIPSDDILYIEITGRKTKVVTLSGSYLTNTTLRAWQNTLPRTFFFAVHSSFIVNVRAIVRYTRAEVTLQNGDVIPVAYRKQAAFRKFFFEFCQR